MTERQWGGPTANPIAVLREDFDDGAVLFNPDTVEVVGISPVGVMIWKLLDGRHTFKEIVMAVEGCFAEVPETVQDDVIAFIDHLAECGLVCYESEGHGA